MSNQHIGSSFDDFLEEDGLLADCQAEAVKRVLAWQIVESMESAGLSKTAMAEKLGTSRSALDRLLNPANISVNLKTLASAASVLGKRLEIRLT